MNAKLKPTQISLEDQVYYLETFLKYPIKTIIYNDYMDNYSYDFSGMTNGLPLKNAFESIFKVCPLAQPFLLKCAVRVYENCVAAYYNEYEFAHDKARSVAIQQFFTALETL